MFFFTIYSSNSHRPVQIDFDKICTKRYENKFRTHTINKILFKPRSFFEIRIYFNSMYTFKAKSRTLNWCIYKREAPKRVFDSGLDNRRVEGAHGAWGPLSINNFFIDIVKKKGSKWPQSWLVIIWRALKPLIKWSTDLKIYAFI